MINILAADFQQLFYNTYYQHKEMERQLQKSHVSTKLPLTNLQLTHIN